MSSTCFKLGGSFSGRQMHTELWYISFYTYHCKRSCRWKSSKHIDDIKN